MASEANGALWISPNDELLGGESNSMERTFKGQGKALEYCRWGGFFFLLPVDKLRVDQNFFPLVLQGEFSVVVVLPATEPALPMTAMETISSAFLRSSSAISVVQAIFMMDDVMILEQSFCHLVILRILLHWQGCCIMHLHRTNFSVTATKLNNRFSPHFFGGGIYCLSSGKKTWKILADTVTCSNICKLCKTVGPCKAAFCMIINPLHCLFRLFQSS